MTAPTSNSIMTSLLRSAAAVSLHVDTRTMTASRYSPTVADRQ